MNMIRPQSVRLNMNTTGYEYDIYYDTDPTIFIYI
jgi:hypothetical protein